MGDCQRNRQSRAKSNRKNKPRKRSAQRVFQMQQVLHENDQHNAEQALAKGVAKDAAGFGRIEIFVDPLLGAEGDPDDGAEHEQK